MPQSRRIASSCSELSLSFFEPGCGCLLPIKRSRFAMNNCSRTLYEKLSQMGCGAVLRYLRDRGLRRTFMVGLATDFCVHYSAVDARRLGFVFTSFRVGTSYLNLITEPTERRWSWWGRVIFYVADVDALYDRALAAEYQPGTAPRDAEWGERFFHLIDPDGHELSFARPLLPASGQ
jgi:hypothetical protein